NAAAAAGGEVAPRALALHALARRRILGLHLRPVALELLGHHLRKAGERALPHLRTRNPDDDRVVGTNDDPRRDLGRAVLRANDRGAERNLQSERQTGADGGGADDEGAAVELGGDHGAPPMPSPRREWPRAPAGRFRIDRCW